MPKIDPPTETLLPSRFLKLERGPSVQVEHVDSPDHFPLGTNLSPITRFGGVDVAPSFNLEESREEIAMRGSSGTGGSGMVALNSETSEEIAPMITHLI
jgi:hypothetical protein